MDRDGSTMAGSEDTVDDDGSEGPNRRMCENCHHMPPFFGVDEEELMTLPYYFAGGREGCCKVPRSIFQYFKERL
jgi:hypothetical protein